jgi:Arc/MetJ-type ribon-helix-helix transcriptional regulator
MELELTPDQEAFVPQAIRTGRIQRAEDAVTEALLLWEDRELLRSEFLASLDDAKASIASGEGIPITQASMRSLADDVNRRGRERLASERQRRTDGT